jgi:4-hydroxybenzoate polyprenyltransferase/phosphoserine phosphatase
VNRTPAAEVCGLERPRNAAPDADVPLVVDLDGTLLRTDTLVESLLVLAREHPLDVLRAVAWLAHGRAEFKHRVAGRAHVDVHVLPWSHDLLEHLRAEKRRGRRLILATGADESWARAVAGETGLFDAVLASAGGVNLTAEAKRDRLVAQYGVGGFDYAGNSRRDLPVWAAARKGVLVNPSPRLAAAAQRVTQVERVFGDGRGSLSTTLGAMRVKHWLKNLLLLVPLLAAHRLYDPVLLAQALLGLLCFCLAASGVYLLNDLLDLPADRRHPHKKERALAAGRLSVLRALLLLPALWGSAAALSLWLNPKFGLSLAVYVVLMVAYSLRLKDIAIVDAFALGMGYTLRILAGGLAVGIDVSPWLLVSSAALFFSLALQKRYAELIALRTGRVRAYRSSDAAMIAGLGAAAAGVAVALLALFPIVEPTGHARWPVWLVCALLLFWTGHMWLMAHRGNIHDDPVSFALRDKVSRGFGVAIAAVLVLAT